MNTDFIELIQRRNEKSNEWWGYNQINGWVILNRKLTRNQSPISKEHKYVFIRCSDWSQYEDLASNWSMPNYIYGVQYLKQLSAEKIIEVNENLYKIFSYYKENKNYIKKEQLLNEEKLEAQKLQEIHNLYLEARGLPKQEIIKNKFKNRRTSHCWNCLSTVDSNSDYECKGCGWIICRHCGACEKSICKAEKRTY